MKCKICWAVCVVLLALICAGAYKFIVQGSTVEAEDGRTAVLLSEGERNQVLSEMRGLLEAVQEITDAIGQGDNAAVATAASAVGMSETEGESASLMGKMPLELMTQGRGMHQGFDNITALAATGATPQDLAGALADQMGRCTACHAGYRFDVGE